MKFAYSLKYVRSAGAFSYFLAASIAKHSVFVFMLRKGQLVMPDWKRKPERVSLASIKRILPPNFFKVAATTDSFSTGLSEQVEYVILPPTLSSSMPLSRIYICRACRL